MSNQSRSSSRKTTTRKTSTPKKSTRNNSSKPGQTSVANNGSTFAEILYIARNTLAGKILLTAILLSILFGLNLLFSMNRFDRFFTLLGVELVIGILIFWVVYLFREHKKNDNEDN